MNKLKFFVLPILVFPFLIGCGETVKEYTITWENWDKTVLSTTKAKENEMPTYDKGTPTKPSDEQFAYTFNDWTPEVVKATADATYTATYTSVKIYEITWYNDIEETKVLHSEKVKEGVKPTYHWKDKPTKEGTDQIKYKWNGWEETIVPVAGPASYHAHFDEIAKWQVTFKNYDDNELQKAWVAEDETPEYTGDTPTKPSADGIMYTFSGWDHEPIPPTKDTNNVYIAKYDEIAAAVTMTVNVSADVEESDKVMFMYDYDEKITTVDWGDGKTDALNEHTYEKDGTYTVYVWGTITSFSTQSPGVNSITLSSQITSIEEVAFANSKIESIYIPASVTTIGKDAFMSCNITIYCEVGSQPSTWDPLWNETFSWVKPILVYWSYVSSGSKDDFNYIVQKINDVEQITITKYIGDNTAKSIDIPNVINGTPVTSIGYCVFEDNTTLETINLTESLTTIGDYAFSGCTSLKGDIDIPNVTTIGECAFYQCAAISSVSNSKELISIGDYAFSYCYSLKNIFIPDTISSIGKYAFNLCPLSFKEESNLCYLSSETNEYFALIKEKTYEAQTTYSINSNCKMIVGGNAFYYDGVVTSVTIPNSVESIGDQTFIYCSSLTTVDLSGVNHLIAGIGSMFFECISLEKILVKSEWVDTYKAAPGWSAYADKIVAAE